MKTKASLLKYETAPRTTTTAAGKSVGADLKGDLARTSNILRPIFQVFYTIYRQLELNLRIKPRKRLVRVQPEALSVPASLNDTWSMDFMHDQLADGRSIPRWIAVGTRIADRPPLRSQQAQFMHWAPNSKQQCSSTASTPVLSRCQLINMFRRRTNASFSDGTDLSCQCIKLVGKRSLVTALQQ